MRIKLPATAAFWIACCCLAHAQDPVQLAWKLSVGDQFQVKLIDRTALESVYFPLSSRQDTDVEIELDWRVASLEDEVAKIEQTVQRIRLNLLTPTDDGSNRIEIDTARDDPLRGTAAAMRKQLLSLVGLTVVVQMKLDGAIVGVELPEASQEKLRQAPSATVLKEMFSSAGISGLFRQTSFSVPAEPLQPGQEWQASVAAGLTWNGQDMMRTYTYRGPETNDDRTWARIDVSFSLVPRADSSQAANETGGDTANPLVTLPSIKAFSGSGFVRFDTERGQLAEMETTLELTTTAALRDAQIETTIKKLSRMEIARRQAP